MYEVGTQLPSHHASLLTVVMPSKGADVVAMRRQKDMEWRKLSGEESQM